MQSNILFAHVRFITVIFFLFALKVLSWQWFLMKNEFIYSPFFFSLFHPPFFPSQPLCCHHLLHVLDFPCHVPHNDSSANINVHILKYIWSPIFSVGEARAPRYNRETRPLFSHGFHLRNPIRDVLSVKRGHLSRYFYGLPPTDRKSIFFSRFPFVIQSLC